MTIKPTSTTTRYKCEVLRQRKCPGGHTGNSIERSCRECNCYKFPGIKREQCFSNGKKVEPSKFPFLSHEECSSSCKNEGCVPTGKRAQRYACNCVKGDPCVGGESFKRNCDCIACYCRTEGGIEVCTDNKGNIIPNGSSRCTKSLQACVNSCVDSECPSTVKWGCLEAEGELCEDTNERERITKCVECFCQDVNGVEKCTPVNNSIYMEGGVTLTNTKLATAKFSTMAECEKDRLSPFGSCKSSLCGNTPSNLRGVSNTVHSLYRAVSPPTLGIRSTNVLNVDHLAHSKTKVGKVIDNLEDGSIYNTKFNFSTHGFPTPPTKLVFNKRYPRIFNNYISLIVAYFLEREGKDSAWSETYVNELLKNKEHVAQSINPDLNLIFNNLTYVTGKKIDPNDFYSGIIELLLTNKMSEFDPSYYKQVYENQNSLEITSYTKSTDARTNDNIALGIISESLVSVDPRTHSDKNRHFDFIANTKAFHTDIKAEIPITLGTGDVVPLDIGEVGIDITPSGPVSGTDSDVMAMGDGYGYYFPVKVGTKTFALEPTTQISDSYFTPVDALDHATALLGGNTDMKITVSSSNSIDSDGVPFGTEFQSGFNIPTNTSALYFELDLSGIASETSPNNHLLNELKCPYKVVSNLNDATRHSIEAGTRVTEVFLHYNDPFRTYLEDSGKCDLELTNIDFHAFVDGKAPLNGEIIVRGNVPKALVFIPAVGSKFNPFHAKSRINTIDHYEDGSLRVSRSCEFVPYLDEVPANEVKHASSRKFTYEVCGTYGRGELGVLTENHPDGKYDVDASLFTYELSGKTEYENLFYSNTSGYTSSVPDTELPPTTKVAVDIIGNLKTKYDYTHFTWWDIFRRLKMSEYAGLQLEMISNQNLIKALENGVVTGGTLVSMVLSGDKESSTGLRDPNDNTVYLTEEDRLSLLRDGTITEDVTYLSDGDRGA